LALSADGRYLAVGSFDGSVNLWDLAEQRKVIRIGAHAQAVFAVAFAPQRPWLASAGLDGNVILWKVPRENAFADHDLDAECSGFCDLSVPHVRSNCLAH